jgi:hypothetical protein
MLFLSSETKAIKIKPIGILICVAHNYITEDEGRRFLQNGCTCLSNYM